MYVAMATSEPHHKVRGSPRSHDDPGWSHGETPTNGRTNSPDRVKVSTQFLRCLGQPITALSILQGAAHLTTQTPVRAPEFDF